MLNLLWLVPALPLAGFLVLAVFGPRMRRAAVEAVGVLSIAFSAVLSIIITVSFLGAPPEGGVFDQVLWSWMAIGSFHTSIGLYLDALSLVMMVVITFVSFLIHWYSAEFMRGDEGYSRFFAYMNLFVASMVVLVLADNLVALFLGWEGVGLCSYLLIGFWYRDPANGAAARKAFIVTRAGDTAFLVGLLLLFSRLGTLRIPDLLARAAEAWPIGSGAAIAAAALLLGGALGKSAQLPLQTWLPDAMAGPTPTSALIHAATMVTAGVYLIARMHALYALAPPVQSAVAVIGAVTLLMSGCSALVQSDIKRILAYSTISQIGYMFLALGVGAWSAAIFHFMTHAFFKALLFLTAGIVIQGLHEEHNIFRMGGLRREMPFAFWTFLIGGCSLAGFPFVTAGFYSKGLIVWSASASGRGSSWLWAAGVLGVFLTSLYIFRLIFVVFCGGLQSRPSKRPGYRTMIPVAALSVLSIVGGFVEIPPWMGDVHAFSDFLRAVLPSLAKSRPASLSEATSEAFLVLALAVGILLAYFLFLRKRSAVAALAARTTGKALHQLWLNDWGMDFLYDQLFVRPVKWFARIDRRDFIDYIYEGIAALSRAGWRATRVSENGLVRWYAASIAIGAVIFILLAVLL